MDVCRLKVSSLIHLLRESQERSVGYLGGLMLTCCDGVDKEMVWSAVGWINNERRGAGAHRGGLTAVWPY